MWYGANIKILMIGSRYRESSLHLVTTGIYCQLSLPTLQVTVNSGNVTHTIPSPSDLRLYRFEKLMSESSPKLKRENVTSSIAGECISDSATWNISGIVVSQLLQWCWLQLLSVIVMWLFVFRLWSYQIAELQEYVKKLTLKSCLFI